MASPRRWPATGPAAFTNVHYDLALDVSGLDSAIGRVTVRFRRSDTGDAIIDFRGRRLTRALANASRSRRCCCPRDSRERELPGRELQGSASERAPDPLQRLCSATRYFADAALNEDWASGSLGPFNTLEHQAFTFPYIGPAYRPGAGLASVHPG